MTIRAESGIEAKSKTMNEILRRKKYQVKYFQREYKWERNNIEDLLIDLERSFFSNFETGDTRNNVPEYDSYYMGPIVLYRDKTSFIIVDGQQRLTSFTLLMIYLKHLQDDLFKNESKKVQNLDEYIYSQPYENETLNMEISEREPILKGLFDRKISEDMIVNESSQNIHDRFFDIADIFSKNLSRPEILPVYINWIQEKVIFIEIMAQSSDSAYTIFESMNDRGLKLTQSELLKSYLLSNVKDDIEIKSLDKNWKEKIALLNSFDYDADEEFFKTWLRAKYAQSNNAQEANTKSDFDRIGSRFSNWVQDHSKQLLKLDQKDPDTYFYFVHSDFHFYSDLFIDLIKLENQDHGNENVLTLMSFRGISSSLTFPLILSPVQIIDDRDLILKKIEITSNFIDCFSFYRMIQNMSIAHNSVDTTLNKLVVETRNKDIVEITKTYSELIKQTRIDFLKNIDYISTDPMSSRFILSRLYKTIHKEVSFDTLYFQRKKDSYSMYQFMTLDDVDPEVNKMNRKLKEIFVNSLCTSVMVPRNIHSELNKKSVHQRIQYLIENQYFPELENVSLKLEKDNLSEFFKTRNKAMKEFIYNRWKI
ncbi:MAG: DUF262 domain-containing protein [Bacteroidota bacterium]